MATATGLAFVAFVIDPATGDVTEVVVDPPDAAVRRWKVSSDGTTLWTRKVQADQELWLLLPGTDR